MKLHCLFACYDLWFSKTIFFFIISYKEAIYGFTKTVILFSKTCICVMRLQKETNLTRNELCCVNVNHELKKSIWLIPYWILSFIMESNHRTACVDCVCLCLHAANKWIQWRFILRNIDTVKHCCRLLLLVLSSYLIWSMRNVTNYDITSSSP